MASPLRLSGATAVGGWLGGTKATDEGMGKISYGSGLFK
jgi:hypothetical protein